MDKLGLYTYIDGINDTPFPSAEEQLVLNAFTYTSERMGGAPTISATAKHRLLLDNLWTDKVYVKFKEEMLFIRNTPSTTKDNTDTRYSYEIEFLSDRDQLNRIYFIDAVQGNSDVDVYKSNSTKVLFMGTIYEFADRLKSCLAYFGLDYTVEVEDDLPTESKLVEFEDLYILSALQEMFNIYEIPYYFSGKKIHIGFSSEAIAGAIWEYNGNRGTLLSISRQNENYAIINKIKGVGSSDNIPYYYPNESADREEVEASGKTWITPMPNLMPSIYRESQGGTMFYEAKNNTYTNEEGEYYVFENEFSENNQRQGSTNFDEIKPTIKEAVNALGYRMDMFSAFDYDRNDNDQLDEDNNYVHPYFYGKLRKFDGEYGFNLFDHAIEGDTMRFAMTSGVCGACEFELGVDEESGKNIIQVTDDGLLKRDADGNVLLGEPQERQNNTQNYEVWIALKKEDTTYGQIMPNVGQNLRPSVNDTFVILGISMPQSYILRAEKKLEDSLIKHMFENNMEKFNFSIKFSKVYFRDSPGLTEPLNENAMVRVFYDGRIYLLNVTSYTYKVDEGSVLPDIEVELAEKLTIGKNSLQMQLDAVKQDILSSVGSSAETLRMAMKYFLRKDVSDTARGHITLKKGATFGDFQSGVLGSGGAVSIDENGSSFAEFDYLTVRRKALFTEITIQELKHIGGSLIISPASMVISKVEETTGGYKCYFETTDNDGRKIYNQFEAGDQARSQTFNLETQEGGAKGNRYWWRLVTEVGVNYIVLSKTDADTNSDIPIVGDNVSQLGNRTDTSRQNAQVYSAYGDDAPSRVMYQGINSFSLTGKAIKYEGYDITTNRFKEETYGDAYFGDRDKNNFLSYSTDNGVEVKGRVTLEQGSVGASNLEDLPDEIAKTVVVGSENLLRNTGFVGDYEPKDLSESDSLEGDTQMYSASLKYWIGDAEVIQDSGSLSGYSAKINSLRQYVELIENEKYTISYKAKNGNISCNVGGEIVSDNLTSEYQRYSHTITAKSTTFEIYGGGTVCEIKLERGTIATDWCPSVLDPAPVKDLFKDLWYLQSAMQGNTTTIGGLNLTSMILLGQFLDGEMKKVNAGVSGVYNDNDDVAFWAGGNLEEAIKTVQKLKDGYTPTDTEWNSLAKFVATHGGDLFLRGYIYALGGLFRGRVEAGDDQRKVIINPEEGSLSFYYMGKKRIDVLYGQKLESTSAISVNMYDEQGNNNVWLNQYGLFSRISEDENYEIVSSMDAKGVSFIKYPKTGTGRAQTIAEIGIRTDLEDATLSKLVIYGKIPTKDDILSVGQVYQENGFLKVKTE